MNILRAEHFAQRILLLYYMSKYFVTCTDIIAKCYEKLCALLSLFEILVSQVCVICMKFISVMRVFSFNIGS